MDAVDRLRERAQNEQTVLALNAFCKQLEADLAKEREKVKELAHQKGALIDRADTYYQKLAAAQATIAEAADEIESWGSYASDYFQDKHDLAGTVARFRSTNQDALLEALAKECERLANFYDAGYGTNQSVPRWLREEAVDHRARKEWK